MAALGITKLITTAISTINNSIDGAVSRIDTLNNFPKVMSNLEISTEESTKAINKLSDGLQGLPTTLDEGALAVQRFTSKNGDVNKSVDLFLAVNNALLAGGASADIQSSAMEQLSQAYAKGKPDMMEWRSLMTAMPAQLKQVATAMGYVSTDKLGEDLRNGKVSMDEFMDTIMKLNKEGTKGFKSFEEQAKNSTGGIQTSITNAKTAITRGVANIVDTVDKALKKTELEGLGNVISKIGKVSENVLKKVANAISKIDLNSIIKRIKNIVIVYGSKLKSLVSDIVKGMTNLWSIIQKNKSAIIMLVSVVLGLISAYKSYQLVLKAIQTINIVSSIASAINPVALLVAGITALTVAVGLSVSAIDKQKRSMEGLKEEAEAQQTTWANLKKTREESLLNSLNEITTTQKLADELRQITDENGKVKEGYENRAKYILGELNKALGTEYTMNDNIITQYEELKNNIDNLILSKRAEATLNSYKSEYETALTKQTEATKTLTELRQKYNEELNRSTEGYQDEMKKARDVKHIGEQIKNQTKLIGDYGYTVQNYEKLTSASVSGNAEEISKAIEDMGISYDEAKNKVKSSLNEQISSQTNYVNLLRESWQDAKMNNDTIQEQILKTQLKTQEEELVNLAKSLAQQTSTVGDLTEEQKQAWKNLADSSYDAYKEGLKDLPEETQKKIEEATGVVTLDSQLSNAFKEDSASATMFFGDNLKLADKTEENLLKTKKKLEDDKKVSDASKTLASNTSKGFNDNVDGKKWGGDLVQNIVSGLWNMTTIGKITNASKSIAGLISDYLHHTTPEKGPLKDDDKWMSDFIDNMANGIDKNKSKVLRTVQGLSSDMEKRLQNVVNLEVGRMNATALVKSNSIHNNVIQATFNIDGSVNMNSRKVGQVVAPEVTKVIKAGGLA